MSLINELTLSLGLLFAQPAQVPSIALDPTSPQAPDVHWTITLSAPYCGGFVIGDGVYVQPKSPFALPADIPADAVRFAGQRADVSLQDGVLRVAPSPALPRSMVCQTGPRPFTVELLGSLGLSNPDVGTYTVDVWLGSDSTGSPQQIPVTIGTPTQANAPATACDSTRQNVAAATAALQADNSGLARTFDAIRTQTADVAAQAPGLLGTQAELVRQLDGVQSTSQAMFSGGWNPDIAYAAQAIDWAHGAARADLTALHNPTVQSEAEQASVVAVISLVQLAQQQSENANTASQRLFDVIQQLGDCGLGVSLAP